MTRFRLTARGLMPRPSLPEESEGPEDASAARIGTRRIYVEAVGGLALERDLRLRPSPSRTRRRGAGGNPHTESRPLRSSRAIGRGWTAGATSW
jgi:hypothetical protein